jgi:histidine ammonia-lyase
MTQLAADQDFHPSPRVSRAHAKLRQHIGFMQRDRAMDGEVASVCALIESNTLLD